MGRFETAWLTSESDLSALTDLSGAWIDLVHARKPQTAIVLDTWTAASARPTAHKRVAPTTDISAAPATIRCSCSTSSAI
jgi:hypothetical protein